MTNADSRGRTSFTLELFLVYVILNVALLLYPTRYFFGFSQLESLQVIPDPVIFAVLFTTWIAIFILVSFRKSCTRSIRIFLILTFSVTCSLITYKIAPMGLDHNYFIDIVLSTYIEKVGHFQIPPPASLNYLTFPGLMLLTYSVKSILGTSFQVATEIVQSSLYAVLGLSMYLLSSFIVPDKRVSMLAVPAFFALSLQSQAILLTFPWTMGVTLFSVSLVTLFRGPLNDSSKVAILILVLAMIITHFYDPADLLVVLFVIGIASIFIPHFRKFWRIFLIIFVVDLSYFVFAEILYSGSLFRLSTNSLLNIFSRSSILYELNVASVNTYGVPWWASLTRYFDLLSMSVLGMFLAYITIIRIKRKPQRTVLLFSLGTLGITAFGILAFIASISQGGTNLLVGPQDVVFLSIPLALYYANKRKMFIVIFIIGLLIFAAPTQFGLKYTQIATITVYPSELKAGAFFAEFIPAQNVTVVTDYHTYGSFGAADPFLTVIQYPTPLTAIQYDPQAYNVVNLLYFRYQQHLYGFTINDSVLNFHDVVFDDGYIFIMPPAFYY